MMEKITYLIPVENSGSEITPEFISFNELTINKVVNEFLEQYNSEETKRAYRRDILGFFNKLGVTYLHALKDIPYFKIVNTITEYINSFRKTDKHNPDRILNPRTINRIAYALSAFFSYLVDVYNYPKNPLKRYKSQEVNRHSTTVSFTRAEMMEILESVKQNYLLKPTIKNTRDYLVIMFLFALALRRKELCGLRWQDIKYTGSQAHIDVFQKGRSIKRLPLPPALLDLLREYQKQLTIQSNYIFTPLKNNRSKVYDKPLDAASIFRIVKEIVRKVMPYKAELISPHSFRKTFIEMSLNNNDSFIDIINGTGHSSAEMVKYYDSRDKLKHNSVNRIGSML